MIKNHNKLVRDKIPEIIIKNNGKPKTAVLSNARFKIKLREKLVEEAKEVQAEENDMLNELADVLELTKSVAKEFGIDFEDVEKKQRKKRKERGGFEKKIYLKSVEK